jgi:TPR repeat protein
MDIEGQAGPKDLVQALAWAMLASRNGDAEAVRLRQTLEQSLNSGQVEDARNRSLGFQAGQSQ